MQCRRCFTPFGKLDKKRDLTAWNKFHTIFEQLPARTNNERECDQCACETPSGLIGCAVCIKRCSICEEETHCGKHSAKCKYCNIFTCSRCMPQHYSAHYVHVRPTAPEQPRPPPRSTSLQQAEQRYQEVAKMTAKPADLCYGEDLYSGFPASFNQQY